MTTSDQSEAEAAPAGAGEADGQPEPPVAWLIRAGGGGEVSAYNIEHRLARIGYTSYGPLPDLRSLSSYGDLVEAMRSASADTADGALAKPKTIEERARQLWMFGTEVRVGHLVVMPRMTDHVAVGEVETEYWYDEGDPDWPHRVSVHWRHRMVPHTDLKDDLLRSIKAPGTIHPIRSTDAPWRLQQVMETGRDPGARAGDKTGPENGADLMLETRERRARDKSKDHLYGRVYRSALDRLAALGREHATLSVYIAHLSLMAQDGWHSQANWVVADLARVPRTEVSRHNNWLEDAGMIAVERSPGQRSRVVLADADLPALIEQFRSETAYPTDAHKEQERLRAEWAEKLAPENVTSLTREDLAAYLNNSVSYGEYVKPGTRIPKWILDLDDSQYARLLDSIRDLCWGTDELPTKIDRLVDERGASRKDTGTKGFAQWSLNATLAVCHPDRFLPLVGHGGKWGFKPMLHRLGLHEPHGSTYGQQFVDANDRLREHLVPHLDDDPQAIACFLYWLIGQETDSIGSSEPGEASDLATLVERFRAETDYPTEAHEEQERLRAEWAEKLALENIESLSREDLTAFTNHAVNNGEYVRRVGGVMHWIPDLGEPEFDKLLDNIRYLCWGEDELSVRFDQLYLGDSPRKVKGYAGVNISRTLAICRPDSFLPVHRNVGNWGRAKMLSRLGLPAPLGNTPGQRVVDANNRLREHLEPHFGDDTLAMGTFLGWLLALPDENGPGPIDLTELAAELLIDDVDFLEDIVELLQDKGQVILYGPPGTGKTYLARELAKELAADDSCRALVQFHPSTSYEDFFEGYRPAGTGNDGNVRYELTPGPLARMAEQASEAPKKQHVMIIDEINRGNLPRVLGELLFLLEYRKESVQTLYRSEEPFELPKNLWFIGTMNTADRSIALVDAALRRRFHFVPFFPDSGPMAGLLGRWLKAQQPPEPAWVGELVEAVNDELKQELGGSHLLLGPSHFMKEYGSSLDAQRRLRRIWEYNIEPFIEDQFFGDPQQIDRFRFDAVMRRNGPTAGSDVDADDGGGDPEGTSGPEDEHAAAEGDTAPEAGAMQPEGER